MMISLFFWIMLAVAFIVLYAWALPPDDKN